jgi:hypothetical protein
LKFQILKGLTAKRGARTLFRCNGPGGCGL